MSPDRFRSADIIAVLARWFLGGLFVYMGLNKALHPADFLKMVHQYEMLNAPLALNLVAAVLPWFEIFCGALLLSGIAVRGSALLLILMLVPFTIVVGIRAANIAASQAIPFTQVKFDCGCGTGEVVIWRKMLGNTCLVFLSGWLVAASRQRFCARFSLLSEKPPTPSAA